MQDKRGLSAVVATLIIILLVLVAAGIIWVVVRNIISEGAEGIELGRFTLDLSIKSAYIDGTNVKVLVRRNVGGGDLVGVRFIFFNGTHSISVDRKIPLIELEERLFSFDSSEVGDINALQEVSIAPIYESSSGRETVGDITDTATISSSAPGGNGNGNGNGGAVCGDGSLDLGEECDDGNTDDGDGCSSTCQDEGTGQSFCGDGTCDIIEDISNCPVDCEIPSSCDGVWNQTDIDAGTACDGGANCEFTCTCLTGFTPDGAGGCDLNPPVDTGMINSVWNIIYFDSQTFPKSQVTMQGYIGYYVNFSNSDETACFKIDFADYVMDPADMSYVRLDDSLGFPNINSSEGYLIWEAEYCGT